jgi:gluconolactonase
MRLLRRSSGPALVSPALVSLALLAAPVVRAGDPPATTPAEPAATEAPPLATPPAEPLAPKWPRQDGEANEDIAGVVAKGTPILKWSEGHNFTEAPACAPDGTVWFADIPASEILRVDPMGAKIVAKDVKNVFGLFVAKDGTLYGCQGGAGAIVAVNPDDGALRTVCDRRAAIEPSGTALGRVNDLVVDDAGGIWFTAPVLGRRRADAPPDAVYFVATKDGAPAATDAPGTGAGTTDAPAPAPREAIEVLRDDALRGPNGIHLSPDGKTLYVVPYLSLDIMAYPIEGPGKVGAGRVLYKIPAGTRQTIGGDGLTVDREGRIYVAIPARAAIFVLSPAGEPLGMIRFPEAPSNCCLGGKDGKTLFVTAQSGVYSIEVSTPRSR